MSQYVTAGYACNHCATMFVNADTSAIDDDTEALATFEGNLDYVAYVEVDPDDEGPEGYFECRLCDQVCLGDAHGVYLIDC